MPCDFSSRHPLSDKKEDMKIWVNRLAENSVPDAVTLEEVHKATQEVRQTGQGRAEGQIEHQEVKVGDNVLLLQNKITTKQPYDTDPNTVTKVVGTQLTGERRGKQRMRSIERLRIVQPRPDHSISKKRRRLGDTRKFILEESSDSEVEHVQRGL